VLHGGEKFTASCLIDDACIAAIEENIPLGPLHNPANLMGIRACQEVLPSVPQVAVFDTAFHQTMPDYAYMYALPYELYEKYGVRRYGFHGTSHRYVSQRVCEFLGIDPEKSRIITCHIGNGASIAAVKYGKCVDTSMGLTPLEGLVMGTRSGDIDAGAVTFIMDKLNLDTKGMSNLLNKQSGLAGISELSSDFRDILAGIANGNEKARLAKDMYFYRIKKYIGQYAAAMGGVDVILFTGGAGENQWEVRSETTSGLEFMGIKIDNEKNQACRATEAVISADDSQVKVCVIPTDEELMIALDTQALAG
jgi:acetate kinase